MEFVYGTPFDNDPTPDTKCKRVAELNQTRSHSLLLTDQNSLQCTHRALKIVHKLKSHAYRKMGKYMECQCHT